MPVPTAYTEEELAQYMIDSLRDVATSLGWNAASMGEPVVSALVRVGVSSIDEVTSDQIALLRSAARCEAWRAVAAATAGDFDFDADATSLKRSQVHKQALDVLAMEEAEFARLSEDPDAFTAHVQEVSYTQDPYQVRDETAIGW